MANTQRGKGISGQQINLTKQREGARDKRGNWMQLEGMSRDRNWNQTEMQKLTLFLKTHAEDFASDRARKASKVYKAMSLFMETRNANQCRSYVQKLITKFHSMEGAILFLDQIAPKQEEEDNTKSGQAAEKKGDVGSVLANWQTSDQVEPVDFVPENIKKTDILEEKEELSPTGGDYEAEQQSIKLTGKRQSFLQSNHFEQSDNSYQQMPFLQLDYPSVPRQKASIEETLPFLSFENSFYSQQANAEDGRRNEWLRCHELFVLWTTSLGRLLQEGGGASGYSRF